MQKCGTAGIKEGREEEVDRLRGSGDSRDLYGVLKQKGEVRAIPNFGDSKGFDQKEISAISSMRKSLKNSVFSSSF